MEIEANGQTNNLENGCAYTLARVAEFGCLNDVFTVPVFGAIRVRKTIIESSNPLKNPAILERDYFYKFKCSISQCYCYNIYKYEMLYLEYNAN